MSNVREDAEDAYELLTKIQGFDAFSLGPHSSIEQIARAFQTQSLIWLPDKNPGDAQAIRIYNRMTEAYNTLVDPESRRKHDAARAKARGEAAPPATNGNNARQSTQQRAEAEEESTDSSEDEEAPAPTRAPSTTTQSQSGARRAAAPVAASARTATTTQRPIHTKPVHTLAGTSSAPSHGTMRCARILLGLASLSGLGLGGMLIIYPAVM